MHVSHLPVWRLVALFYSDVFNGMIGAVLGTVVEALGVVVASHIYLAIGRKVHGQTSSK